MSDTRLTNPPKGYQRPADLPLVTIAAVRALLPRLRCGACGSRLSVEPGTLGPGRLFCFACGRDYAEVVDRLPERVSFSDEPAPRRGRPPQPSRCTLAECVRPGPSGGRCSACRTQRQRAQEGAGA